MTQDILMSSDECPVAPTNDTASKQLQQFCLLAKTAHGAAILELIKQVLEAPGVYVFGELLVMPNIEEVGLEDLQIQWLMFSLCTQCGTLVFYSLKKATMSSITIH